jgi:hypothetical protein
MRSTTTVFREDLRDAGRSDLVSGAADPLKSTRDRGGGFDEDDEIDRGHVDPEFERGGGDHAAEVAAFEAVLDLGALFARNGAVVRLDDLLTCEPVHLGGEPLGEPARVHEEDRRAMREHQIEESRVDRRPDRSLRRGVAVPASRRSGLVRAGHVLDGHHDLDVDLLLAGCVHDRHRPLIPSGLTGDPATQEAGDRVERPLRRGQADALRVVGDVGQTFERDREVGTSLGSCDRMNLVDDDPPNGEEDLSGP